MPSSYLVGRILFVVQVVGVSRENSDWFNLVGHGYIGLLSLSTVIVKGSWWCLSINPSSRYLDLDGERAKSWQYLADKSHQSCT